GDHVARVRDDRMRHLLRKRLAGREPALIGVPRVGTDADQGDLLAFELVRETLESLDLRRTDEGEVQRIPVEHVPAASEVVLAEHTLLAAGIGDTGPAGLRTADQGERCILRHLSSPPAARRRARPRRRSPAGIPWSPDRL